MTSVGIEGSASLSRNDIPFEKGLSREEVRNRYNQWQDYNNYMEPETSYNGPIFAADAVNRHIRNKHARILDIGAGTGHIAHYLTQYGFTNMDALEPSVLMKQAKAKNVYKNYYNIFFGVGTESETTIPDATYDAIVSSGVYGESHLPVNSIDESLRILRPGGVCIIVMREEWLEEVEAYRGKLEPYMKKLNSEGKWKRLERSTRSNYFVDKDGAIFVYQKY